MKSHNFYQSLPAFKEFNEFIVEKHFFRVPEDWSIIITDIKGSTKAIAEGRYKEVNTLGAASIVVARKAMEQEDFPFIFGGDGATMLVPDHRAEGVINNLCGLKALAINNYELDLRVGLIRVSELYKMDKIVLLAKYEITKGKFVAVLKGDGISMAEKLVKDSPERYEIAARPDADADLDGLSCRWKPIPSKRGRILTMLIQARENENQVYGEFLKKLSEILPDGLEASNPANIEKMTYHSFADCIRGERKYHASIINLKFILKFIQIAVSVLVFRLGTKPIFLKKYEVSMRTHSDFRKFDDVLRMVLDCSDTQIQQIKSYLEKAYSDKELFYGLFETDNSLMTCFVEGLNQGEHIHFIDADNGGYAMAALQLKSQMKEAKNT
ncbi:MAG TPA: DUF3095 family protein [Bacteriovoracaceae bacterium]|nr:DUF3095 family protein [Bacteriovoracaceae bacterium]